MNIPKLPFYNPFKTQPQPRSSGGSGWGSGKIIDKRPIPAVARPKLPPVRKMMPYAVKKLPISTSGK
jgi:hypothetical protein